MFSRIARKMRSRPRPTARLSVEALEWRWAPSVSGLDLDLAASAGVPEQNPPAGAETNEGASVDSETPAANEEGKERPPASEKVLFPPLSAGEARQPARSLPPGPSPASGWGFLMAAIGDEPVVKSLAPRAPKLLSLPDPPASFSGGPPIIQQASFSTVSTTAVAGTDVGLPAVGSGPTGEPELVPAGDDDSRSIAFLPSADSMRSVAAIGATPADLILDVPMDLHDIEEGTRRFFEQLEQVGQGMAEQMESTSRAPWLLLLSAATAAADVVRRRRAPAPAAVRAGLFRVRV